MERAIEHQEELTKQKPREPKKVEKRQGIQSKTIKKLLRLILEREDRIKSNHQIPPFYSACSLIKIDPKTAKKYIDKYDPDLREGWESKQYAGKKFIDAIYGDDPRVDDIYFEITGKRL